MTEITIFTKTPKRLAELFFAVGQECDTQCLCLTYYITEAAFCKNTVSPERGVPETTELDLLALVNTGPLAQSCS